MQPLAALQSNRFSMAAQQLLVSQTSDFSCWCLPKRDYSQAPKPQDTPHDHVRYPLPSDTMMSLLCYVCAQDHQHLVFSDFSNALSWLQEHVNIENEIEKELQRAGDRGGIKALLAVSFQSIWAVSGYLFVYMNPWQVMKAMLVTTSHQEILLHRLFW